MRTNELYIDDFKFANWTSDSSTIVSTNFQFFPFLNPKYQFFFSYTRIFPPAAAAAVGLLKSKFHDVIIFTR